MSRQSKLDEAEYPIRRAVQDALADLSPKEKAERMERSFLIAVKAGNEFAGLYWEILTEYLRDHLKGEGTSSKQKNESDRICVEKCMSLYPIGISLELTQEKMLGFIAGTWQQCNDPELSDKCFCFLMKVLEKLPYCGESHPLESVLRKATNENFPSSRLLKYFIEFLTAEDFRSFRIQERGERVAKILLVAWARNNDLRVSSDIFSASQKIFELESTRFKTSAAFDLLRRYSAEVAELERATQDLLTRLGGIVSTVVPGKKSVSYSDTCRLELLIKETSVRAAINRMEENQRRGEKHFESARECILTWMKDYPGYSVKVRLENVTDISGKILFEKEEELN